MTFSDTLLRFQAVIAELSPTADLSPGSVLNELLLKVAAQLHQDITDSDINALSDGRSVKTITESAVETYSPIIDSIASNYGVTRDEGRKVTGVIKVFVVSSRGYFIPTGTIFNQPNLSFTYVTAVPYDVVVSSGVTSKYTQLDLRKDIGGLYYFLLPVVASEVGEGTKNNTQIVHGTQFGLTSVNSIPGFVKAEAFGNFSSGKNKETDRELVSRFREGLSYKGLSSVLALNSVLRSEFPVVQAVSVAGAGDTELTRDKHNIFGMATFGKADIYVRTSTSVESQVVTVTGTRNGGTGRWTISLASSVAPGFYRVLSILPKNAIDEDQNAEVQANNEIVSAITANGGSLKVYAQTYGFELTQDGGRNNDVINAAEARYSRYQTCTVEFEYASTNPTETFYVQLAYPNLLNEIQDYLNDDDTRHIGSDYLAKGIIPCLVNIHVRLQRKPGVLELPTTSIRQDIFDYVNAIPLGETLKVSKIIDICHNYDVQRVDLPVNVTGYIWLPSTGKDTTYTINGADELVIPSETTLGISPKNVAFFASYLDTSGEASILIEEI